MVVNQQKMLTRLKSEINGDICNLMEKVFRIRSTEGKLIDYIMPEPHKQLARTGLIGDRSKLFRVINKGRQGGFSTYAGIEMLTTAQLYPNTYQYYVATKEQQAKSFLKRKIEKPAKDCRLWFDGSRIIDVDSTKSSQLMKAIKHFPKGIKKEVEYSYVVGLAASPSGVRGESGISITLDEYAQMNQRVNMQKELYEAVKYFIASGGQLSAQSTPMVTSDEFWNMYSKPREYKMNSFYFPVIENWEDINIFKPLYYETENLSEEKIKKLLGSGYVWRVVKVETKMKKILSQPMKIPYFWYDYAILEKSRDDDIDWFKQEILGIPVDRTYRYIPPEIVYPNVTSVEKFTAGMGETYIIAIDVARIKDITAITVGEIMDNGTIQERWIEETQDPFPQQAELISDLCERYKPMEIRIDNTGSGIGLADILEDMANMPTINRVDFRSYMEFEKSKMRIPEYLAMEFKKMLVAGIYKMLNHGHALLHVFNVEKKQTVTGSVHFTGKRGGTTRDDHFWSKAMLAAKLEGTGSIGTFVTSPVGARSNESGRSSADNVICF